MMYSSSTCRLWHMTTRLDSTRKCNASGSGVFVSSKQRVRFFRFVCLRFFCQTEHVIFYAQNAQKHVMSVRQSNQYPRSQLPLSVSMRFYIDTPGSQNLYNFAPRGPRPICSLVVRPPPFVPL